MMGSQRMGAAHGGRAPPILDQIRAELARGRTAADNLQNLYSLLPGMIEGSTVNNSSKTGRKRVSDLAQLNLHNNTIGLHDNTKTISRASDSTKPDDIYDGEISLGTKPGVPAEYDSHCLHEAQLKSKDASLQEALNEISNLKSRNDSLEKAMLSTRKNAFEAEEKARLNGIDLAVAKKTIVAKDAQIKSLELRNEDLDKSLNESLDEFDMKHVELTHWKNKYTNDYNEAVRLRDFYRTLGADLFTLMTELEFMVANGCDEFFFNPYVIELKRRAAMNLPLDPNSKTLQSHLFYSWSQQYQKGDVPLEEWTAVDGLPLAIEPPPVNDETDEFLRLMENLPRIMDEETCVVDGLGDIEPTSPEKVTPETNLCSNSEEASLASPTGSSDEKAGRPVSATSNEVEQGPNMGEESNAEVIIEPEVEASSNDEGEQLRFLLGYDPNPEEAFYPQFEKSSESIVSNESAKETTELQEPESSSTAIETPICTGYESAAGPGVQSLLGYNPNPEEAFYPQYEKASESTVSNEAVVELPKPESSSVATESPIYTGYESAAGPGVQSLLGYNPDPEEAFYPQYEKANHLSISTASDETEDLPAMKPDLEESVGPEELQSPSGAMESPLTRYESTTGPAVQSLLGYNPEPEEPFYPQYPPRLEDSTSPSQDEEQQHNATVPDNEPIFDIKPEKRTTATTSSSKPTHIFTSRISSTSSSSSASTTTPATSRTPSIDITFTNTSLPFKARSKPKMTRAQRREAALSKAQAEAEAKQKAEEKGKGKGKNGEGKGKEEVEGKEGKTSRQERRAAERKAGKKAKGPGRGVVRL